MALDSSTATKAYCECTKKTFTYRPLPELDRNIYVHAGCGLPSKDVWLGHIHRCSNCFKNFSSPVESICKSCLAELIKFGEVSPRLWLGWKWASKLTYSFVCLETSVEGHAQLLSAAFEQGRSVTSGTLLAGEHASTGPVSQPSGDNLELTFD
jgi:hypothetical protein